MAEFKRPCPECGVPFLGLDDDDQRPCLLCIKSQQRPGCVPYEILFSDDECESLIKMLAAGLGKPTISLDDPDIIFEE